MVCKCHDDINTKKTRERIHAEWPNPLLLYDGPISQLCEFTKDFVYTCIHLDDGLVCQYLKGAEHGLRSCRELLKLSSPNYKRGSQACVSYATKDGRGHYKVTVSYPGCYNTVIKDQTLA